MPAYAVTLGERVQAGFVLNISNVVCYVLLEHLRRHKKFGSEPVCVDFKRICSLRGLRIAKNYPIAFVYMHIYFVKNQMTQFVRYGEALTIRMVKGTHPDNCLSPIPVQDTGNVI